jgi:hypothetical protein
MAEIGLRSRRRPHGLNGQVMPSTSDEAPGLLAYVKPAFELIT